MVGKDLEEGDVPLGEEMGIGAAKANRADGETLAYQGDVECSAEPQAPRVLDADGEPIELGLHVGDVDRLPCQHRPADAALTAQRKGGGGGDWPVTSGRAPRDRCLH